MAYDIRSITQVGTSEPFELQVARGQIPGHSVVHKFGANFDIDNNSEPETVWTAGGLYPWSALNTEQTLWLESDDTDDESDVEIQGLDKDYNLLTETVTLTSEGAVDTQNKFKRVYRMVYAEENAGVITARAGSDTGTIVAQIDEGYAQTLMAIYTVPAGYSAYILCGDFSVQKNKDAQLRFYQRPFGGAFRIAHMSEVFENHYRYDFPIPLRMPEKTDLDIRADNVETNNTRVTSNFTMCLVKEQGSL